MHLTLMLKNLISFFFSPNKNKNPINIEIMDMSIEQKQVVKLFTSSFT